MGLRVVRNNGRPPGIARTMIRIVIPILTIEVIRLPLMWVTMSPADFQNMTGVQVLFFTGAAIFILYIAILLTLSAKRENGFATVWDLVTGTRVVVKPKGSIRPLIGHTAQFSTGNEVADSLGPYQVSQELIPGEWAVASDPVLRRPVWLLKQRSSELSHARRYLARPGRRRWLQEVEAEGIWDAFEASQGSPFSSVVKDGECVPLGTLRHWLHDLASELWATTEDQTLPAELSLDHVWITAQGQAVLLDTPWPEGETSAENIPVGDLAGQQRFLNAVAMSRCESRCAWIPPTSQCMRDRCCGI